MTDWRFYRLALRLLPPRGRVSQSDFPANLRKETERALCAFRCMGASLCLFDGEKITGSLAFGSARRGVPARIDTVYRAASVSKFVTGLGLMKLSEQGKIDLDADINSYLPFSLRHPHDPDIPLTLRMLMTHTAGFRDGEAYNQGIAKGEKLSVILRGDSFAGHAPGALWEYSNLGAGIAGVVMEAALNRDFETLMQETVFAPLGVTASFYPQKFRETPADAWRILPPRRAPTMDAAARQKKPLPPAEPDPETHYALAHGNLYLSAPALARLGIAGLTPGFLSEKSLEDMRRIAVPFGERARDLSQGLFTFILDNPKVYPRPVYGHQGMAYGAVHGLFFDPAIRRGFALLTSGASEARRGVLADLNAAMIPLLLGEE